MAGDYQEKAEKIIEDIQSAKYMVSIGNYKDINIEATIDEYYITFHNNLGSLNRPSQLEAVDIINKLRDYFFELYSSSLKFKKFIGNRQFRAELYVFSGQMDFPVVTLDGNEIKWQVNLD